MLQRWFSYHSLDLRYKVFLYVCCECFSWIVAERKFPPFLFLFWALIIYVYGHWTVWKVEDLQASKLQSSSQVWAFLCSWCSIDYLLVWMDGRLSVNGDFLHLKKVLFPVWSLQAFFCKSLSSFLYFPGALEEFLAVVRVQLFCIYRWQFLYVEVVHIFQGNLTSCYRPTCIGAPMWEFCSERVRVSNVVLDHTQVSQLPGRGAFSGHQYIWFC